MESIKFVPLLNQQEHGCTCNILRINNVNIMLECGFPENLSLAGQQQLFQNVVAFHMPQVNVLLLSHDPLSYLGFVPLFAKFPSATRTILTTSPICKLGHLALYDYYYSRSMVEPYDLYNLDQVDPVFESIKTIKYKEKFMIESDGDRDNRIKIVPLPSGGTVGGIVWKISYKMLRILYVPRPNLRSEIVSDGLILSELPKLADMVIMDANVSDRKPEEREDGRYVGSMKELKSRIQSHLEKQGKVIIPCDTGSRGLEVMESIKRHMEKYPEKFGVNSQILYTHTMSDRVLEIAHCHLEWMSSRVSHIEWMAGKGTQTEGAKPNENVFVADKRLCCLTNMQQFSQLPTEGGKIIICTQPSLNYGLSRELLQKYLEDPSALFVFPVEPYPDTLAHHLLKLEKMQPIQLQVISRNKIASPRKPSEVELKPEPLVQSPKMRELTRKDSAGKAANERLLFKDLLFMCFEDTERKKRVDDYGETITDVERHQWRKLNPSEEPVNLALENQKKIEYSNLLATKLRYAARHDALG